MLLKEFNSLSLAEKTRLVFAEGKLVDIFEKKHNLQKAFYYKLEELKIDVIFDKSRNTVLDVLAWEHNDERVAFIKLQS